MSEWDVNIQPQQFHWLWAFLFQTKWAPKLGRGWQYMIGQRTFTYVLSPPKGKNQTLDVQSASWTILDHHKLSTSFVSAFRG